MFVTIAANLIAVEVLYCSVDYFIDLSASYLQEPEHTRDPTSYDGEGLLAIPNLGGKGYYYGFHPYPEGTYVGTRPDDVPAPTQITTGALWDLATTQPAGGAPDRASIFLRHYELTQEYHSVRGGMFIHPLASPKVVRPLNEIMLYAVSRDLLTDFIQDPKKHWDANHSSEYAPHVALLLVGCCNLLNGCVDHFMGMVYVSGVQEQLPLAQAVQRLWDDLAPVPPDAETEVPALAVLVGVRHFPPWLCPADPATAFCTFRADPGKSHVPLAELQGGLLRTVGILTNPNVWPCCVVIPEMLNEGVTAIVSRTPPGRFSNTLVGYQQFPLCQGELPVMRHLSAQGPLGYLDNMVTKGFTQHRKLNDEVFVDERAVLTLDAAMEMEEVRACQIAEAAREGELGSFEAAVVAFCTSVGQRLSALDLSPTAGPSRVLAGFLQFTTQQSLSRARDAVNAALDEELTQYHYWRRFAEKDCSRLLSLQTEMLRGDTRLLKIIMCIAIGDDLVLQCAQTRAAASSSGAGDSQDLDERIEAALDSRIITEDLRAMATQALTDAFTSDSENPFIQRLRTAVTRGCEATASLEAAMYLEQNTLSGLQTLPVAQWREALEGVLRGSPDLLTRTVKDAVGAVSPEVILALLHGGSEQVGPEGSVRVYPDGGRRDAGPVHRCGARRDGAPPREDATVLGGG